MTYESALLALADPTRRQVFEHLREGPRAVGEIAAEMPVSRPAVSQHLKVLKEAGLVADQAEGTRRVYYIDPQGLGALRGWLDQFWDHALEAFKAEVEKSKGNPDEPSQHVAPAADHRRPRTQERSRRRRRRPRV
jgi:DNA-binding transcriptional ArsR family regulator